MNMARPYEVVQDAIDEVAHLLSRFPEGPAVEASLAVKEMSFSKGTAYNKLMIQFVEEISYTREQSNLFFKLRDFSDRVSLPRGISVLHSAATCLTAVFPS